MSFDLPVTKGKLAAFKRKKKFSAAEWKKRGLLPSNEAVSAQLEAIFNDLASRLVAALNEANPSSVAENLFTEALRETDRDQYDTEEAEFVCTVFATLAKIFDFRLGHKLNLWLYGEALGEVASEQVEQEAQSKVIQTLSQLCTKCGVALRTEITESRSDNDSESWLAIECASCGELNFLVLPPGIGSIRPNGYTMKSQYWRNQFNRETAEVAFREAHAKRAKSAPASKRRKAA